MLEGITQKQTLFGNRTAQEQTIIGNNSALMEELKSNKFKRYRKERKCLKRTIIYIFDNRKCGE